MIRGALYEGWVRHRRRSPVPHGFRYGLWMLCLDLGDLEGNVTPNLGLIARFRRGDHFGPTDRPLSESIRDEVERQIGSRPQGRIEILTHLRQGGYVFNPVSFYYFWSPDGSSLEAVAAEVHNTPWGETHVYALRADGPKTTRRFAKQFHVSPFMGMNQVYEWTLTAPRGRLAVHMRNWEGDRLMFDATLVMNRRALDARNLRAMAWRHPLATYAVLSRIYFQALRLWLKRVPYHAHPRKAVRGGGSR